MRTVFGLLLGLVVLGLGFWAYQENYRTRASQAELRALQTDIVQMREQMAILRAEWAWLNRPERLRALVHANNGRLGLMDMVPEHFGHLEQVGFPSRSTLTVSPEPRRDSGAAQ